MKRPVTLPAIGWREWVELPDLCETPIKAKVDTGARTSALHAFELRIEHVDGARLASFEVHPWQRSAAGSVRVRWPIVGFRKVRSSNGKSEIRPVVVTHAKVGDHEWELEVTLTSRDAMGFRMLLGRGALKDRFVVDSGRSYVLSRPIQRAMKGTRT